MIIILSYHIIVASMIIIVFMYILVFMVAHEVVAKVGEIDPESEAGYLIYFVFSQIYL